MNKLTRVLAALIAVMMLFSGVSLADKDTSGLLATVNGVDLPIGEVLAEYEYLAEQYRMYGYSNLIIEQTKMELVTSAIQDHLIAEKAKELNLSVDENEVHARAQAEYDYALSYYMDVLNDDSMSEEELKQTAEEMMVLDGYAMEDFEAYYYDSLLRKLIIDTCLADVGVSEEELFAFYEQRVAEEKELFDGDPYLYEDAVTYGDTVTYVPEGFRAVKHILVMLDEESKDRMYEIRDRLMEIDEELAGKDADGEALKAESKQLRSEQETILDTIRPTIGEIQDRLAAGEDFDALMEEFGEDTGMKTEPFKTEGYVIWSGSYMEDGFLTAAMSLENVGDISEPAATPYGLHIVRYERAVTAGPVPYEEVKEALRAELEYDMVNEAYTALLDQWYSEAEIELYLDNFDAE